MITGTGHALISDPPSPVRRSGMIKQAQPVPVAAADHPLRQPRRRRGLTQVELAGLAGLSYSYISMIECGRRRLSKRDHVNALAAALRVPPADIAPSTVPGFDEWAPAASAASGFPAASDEMAMARHSELAGRFIAYVVQGDTYAARACLRRLARDPSVNPGCCWTSSPCRTSPCPARASLGERGAPGICRQHRTGTGWMTAR